MHVDGRGGRVNPNGLDERVFRSPTACGRERGETIALYAGSAVPPKTRAFIDFLVEFMHPKAPWSLEAAH